MQPQGLSAISGVSHLSAKRTVGRDGDMQQFAKANGIHTMGRPALLVLVANPTHRQQQASLAVAFEGDCWGSPRALTATFSWWSALQSDATRCFRHTTNPYGACPYAQMPAPWRRTLLRTLQRYMIVQTTFGLKPPYSPVNIRSASSTRFMCARDSSASGLSPIRRWLETVRI